MHKEKFCSEYTAPIVLGGIFILSRILYYMSGLHFDADTITRTWHFIDIYLLENDLWRNIFYLHTQPPLMNLLTGLGLQLFPDSYASVFQAFFLLGGFTLTLAIYFLGLRFGFPKYLAVILRAGLPSALLRWYTKIIISIPTRPRSC